MMVQTASPYGWYHSQPRWSVVSPRWIHTNGSAMYLTLRLVRNAEAINERASQQTELVLNLAHAHTEWDRLYVLCACFYH